MIAKGQKPELRELTPEEHRHELLRKIIEEAAEFRQAGHDKAIEELADIKQAFDDLVELSGLTAEQVAEVQQAKGARCGGFLAGTYITTLETAAEDTWTDYYRRDPERFPEVD